MYCCDFGISDAMGFMVYKKSLFFEWHDFFIRTIKYIILHIRYARGIIVLLPTVDALFTCKIQNHTALNAHHEISMANVYGRIIVLPHNAARIHTVLLLASFSSFD